MSGSDADKVQVLIPKDLYVELRNLVEGQGFKTVDDFVVYTMRVAVGRKPDTTNEEDDEEVNQRLKALGYT